MREKCCLRLPWIYSLVWTIRTDIFKILIFLNWAIEFPCSLKLKNVYTPTILCSFFYIGLAHVLLHLFLGIWWFPWCNIYSCHFLDFIFELSLRPRNAIHFYILILYLMAVNFLILIVFLKMLLHFLSLQSCLLYQIFISNQHLEFFLFIPNNLCIFLLLYCCPVVKCWKVHW